MIPNGILIKFFWIVFVSLCCVFVSPFIGMQFINPFSLAENELQRRILFSIRIPRTIIGFLAGGGLSLCGMTLQAMFRNPLAEPFTLGISSGAACGAALTILLGVASQFQGFPVITIGALLGAFIAIALVFSFAKAHRYTDSHSILLSGIVVSFLFSSIMMFVQYLSNLRDSFYIVRWLMGGLETYGYGQIVIMFAFVCVGSCIIFFKLPEIDQLLTGEDIAQSRGVNVAKTKFILLFAVTCIAGGIVASCGPISFIGLIVPYIARNIFIINHRVLGPVCFILGGSFLVICDTMARTIFAPMEIPVGVITSLIGAPFFLWLLLFKKRKIQRGMF